MKLGDIIKGVKIVKDVQLDASSSISSIAFDSRKVVEGTLFVAQKGVHVDGHNYVNKAIEAGAIAIVCEILPDDVEQNVSYIQVEDTQKASAEFANNFYHKPSQNLHLVGVTGTNGKTTIATLLYQLFKLLGYKVGLLSTVKVMVDNEQYPATHTTPDSIAINDYLDKMIEAGVEYCFMEVSSHGIDQGRTHGLEFKGGIFTNLTHDHLDYHKTFLAYRNVKKAFFDGLGKTAFALTNLDDKNGGVMLQNTKAAKKTYAQKQLADYKVKVLEKSFEGMLLQINNVEVWTRLVGKFNASNLVAIYGTAKELGVKDEELLMAISQLQSVDGRFEYQVSETGIVTVVDYAHTPDALKNILETIHEIANPQNKIITVVGCGGDRDKAKRPIMAKVAATLSHQLVITSDNPRTEDPDQIIVDMEAGLETDHIAKSLSIADRKQAIKTACQFAKTGDIVLVAGKGHETYQDVNGKKTYFSDKETLITILKTLKK